jgi:ABC-type dipeptide/oligopeptide/nickel transport system permease subunit
MIVALLIGVALFGPLFTPHDPYQFSIRMNEGPGPDHWFGTDDQGHDVLSRLIAGTRLSLLFGAGAALVALGIGAVLSLLSLSLGRVVETGMFAIFDLIRALPVILFALACVAAFEPGPLSVMFALGVSFSPMFAMITRATWRQQMARPYVAAARVLGASRLRVTLVHVLPNIVGALVTQFAIILPRCIVLESVMSFLGLGVSPETPTWGRMIANATSFTESAPHAVLAPIIALSIATFGMALVGDALRRSFDPDRRRIAV